MQCLVDCGIWSCLLEFNPCWGASIRMRLLVLLGVSEPQLLSPVLTAQALEHPTLALNIYPAHSKHQRLTLRLFHGTVELGSDGLLTCRPQAATARQIPGR